MNLKLGLIGCGNIAQLVHLNLLQHLPGARLAALAEPDPLRLAAAARRAPGAQTFTSGEQLLDQAEVEAVVICLPSALHATMALLALARHKHVYLEKPLATDLADGRRVVAAWRQAGVVGMLGFNYRFNALYQSVRQQVVSGRLGPLVAARTIFSTAPRRLPDWKQTRQAGGGALLDLGSHHVDLVRFLFGQEVKSVSAWLRSQQSEADSALVHFQLASGLPVQSFFSLGTGDEDRVEVYGQARRLWVDRYRSFDVTFGEPLDRWARVRRSWRAVASLARSPGLWARLFAPGQEASYHAALLRFVAAVQGRASASPDLADGYRSLAVVAAAEESARTGQTAVVPDD
jgi:predicted dehydrogenase